MQGVGESVAWSVHPYARVYCTILMMAAVSLVGSPAALAVYGITVIVLNIFSGSSIRLMLTGIVPAVSFVAGMLVLSLLSGTGIAGIDYRYAVISTGRIYVAFLLVSNLFAVTHYANVVRAFEFIRVPAIFTSIAYFSFRWTRLLEREARRMNTARGLRGGDSRPKMTQAGDLARISSTIMMRSFMRAERSAAAMECRGFQGNIIRSMGHPIRVNDCLPLIAVVTYISVVWLLVG